MCGLAGFIGASSKPKITYQLITQLFDYLEVRGTDASGVWGTEAGKNGRVVYHKEPIRASEFINKSFWKKLRNIKLDSLLIHARAATKGTEHASVNDNNHPFVSNDKRIGMVHNGNIEEVDFLKKKYELLFDTDSEVLLRIFEDGVDCEVIDLSIQGADSELAKRLNAIKDIWSVVSQGAMAVAIGERIDDNERLLFLFRNEKRPLWVIDLREVLGQIFFVSAPDIWYRAISSGTSTIKDLCSSNQKLIEIPVGEVWVFRIDGQNAHMKDLSQVQRFELEIKSSQQWEYKGDPIKVKPAKLNLPVVTQLEEEKKIKKVLPIICYEEAFAPGYDGGVEHQEICDKIIKTVKDISTTVYNGCMEETLSKSEYQELLVSLEQTRIDLEGTLRLVGEP